MDGRNPAPVENGGKHPIIYRVSTYVSTIQNWWCRISQPSTITSLIAEIILAAARHIPSGYLT